jgi:hypothetical protein
MAMVNLEAEIHTLKTEYLDSRQIHSSILLTLEPTQYYALVSSLSIALIDIATGVDSKKVYQDLETCRYHMESLSGLPHMVVTLCRDLALADLYLHDGNHTEANVMFSACFASSKNGFPVTQTFEFLERLADLSTMMTSVLNTLRWAVIFLSLASKLKNKMATMKELCRLGQILVAEGDDKTAFSLFTVALDEFTFMDAHRWRADCMAQVADIYEKRGEVLKSVALWKMARPLFKRSSQAKDVIRLDMRLAAADLVFLEKAEK